MHARNWNTPLTKMTGTPKVFSLENSPVTSNKTDTPNSSLRTYPAEFIPSESGQGQLAVILLKTAGIEKDAQMHLTRLNQDFPGVPVVLILDTHLPGAEALLSLPASDFHDVQSGEVLLKKRISDLSNRSSTSPIPPLSLLLMREEMELWQTIFEKSGAGMLTGQVKLFIDAVNQSNEKTPSVSELQKLTLADTSLSSVLWELNNKESIELLDLNEPVSLSNRFLKKLKPADPEQFLNALSALGNTTDMVSQEVEFTSNNGELRHLSLGISITSSKDNLLLMTILDITPRMRLEQELRDNLKLLEQRVASRTQDIAISHQQLAHEGTQRKRLTGQLRESFALITQSMIGAKRILEVALPGKKELNTHFPNSILINRPRDIMGGDFLFTGVKKGKKTLALIDSTGHGIPGAMVSLMGSTLINKAFTALETSNPSEILGLFQKEFDLRMQVNQGTPQMYGFDAAIVTVDSENQALQFAGARGDLFLVRDGETQIYRGTRASIDFMHPDSNQAPANPYLCQTIGYLPGDQFYLISDGIRDQFGGERNKKLGRKRLCDMLAMHSNLALLERQKAIEKELLIWKGANAKVDDATLVGIQF